jgi:hypothetical protein
MGRNKKLRVRLDSSRRRITDHRIKIALEQQRANPDRRLIRHWTVANKGSFLAPSSSLLDNHFDEILETTEEIAGLVAILKTLSPTDAKRDEYEGRLYVALTHLDHHVKPAIKEWDRVVDQMPED